MSHRWRFTPLPILAALAVAVIAVAGCSKHTPLAPSTHAGTSAAIHRTPGVPAAAVHLEGSLGPGALYSIDVPETWNGDLVLYAHGYTYPRDPIALPGGAFPGIRGQMLSRGFAIATTSYSENGFAEAEGARQLHQLGGLFDTEVGTPHRTFLIGLSLGGMIVEDLLESFPEQYAGAVSVSGPLGGSKREFNYVGDVRLLWDLLMPCDLPGDFLDVPDTDFPAGLVMTCMQNNQQMVGVIGLVHRADPDSMRVNFRASAMGSDMPLSIAYTLGFHWYGMRDGIERAHGHMLYDNHDAVYVGQGVPPQLLQFINANIARYSSSRDAQNFMRQQHEPSGMLRKPLLTLHSEDPQVPIQHEGFFRDRVEAAGRLDNLLQFRYESRFGHAADPFPPADVALAFDALVEWVDSGVKPLPPFTIAP